MNTRFAVLPIDVVDALTVQLNEKLQQEETFNAGLVFLRLPHPRTGLSSLFLPSVSADGKASKILEVQSIDPTAKRSWFNEAEVISDGSLLVLTPVDPTFLLLPVLQAVSPKDGTAGSFRTVEDLFEEGSAALSKTDDASSGGDSSMSIYESDVTELGRLQCVQDSMKHVCEVKEVNSDLVVYRFSRPNTLLYLEKKVTRLSKGGVIDKSRTLSRELAKDGLMGDDKGKLLELGRIKLACDLVSQYISPALHQELLSRFDFSALDAHVSSMQNDGTLLIQQGNGKSDSQKDAEPDGKKRKAATQASKGVEKLKKVNTKGMAKLSTFFQKSKTKG